MVALSTGLMLGGALLGGAGGLFGKKPKRMAPLERVTQRKSFTGPTGTATPDKFTYKALPGQEEAVSTSGINLNELLSKGLATDPARIKQFQDAYFQARAPRLTETQAGQRSKQAAGRAASGQSGSISAILGNRFLDDTHAQQINQLQSESVLGGENLANQALQQDLAKSNLYNNLIQQYFSNQMNAQSGTQNAFNAQLQNDLNIANQRNAATRGEFSANAPADNFNRFGNVVQGAIGGGMTGFNLAKGFGGGNGLQQPTGSAATPWQGFNNPSYGF